MAADGLALLIFFPAGAGQIPSHDALYRQYLCLFDEHTAADELIGVFIERSRKFRNIIRDKMMLDLGAEKIEPKF